MKTIIFCILAFLAITDFAKADNCLSRFVDIYSGKSEPKPMRVYNTATINGENEQKFNLLTTGPNHTMSQALVPPAPWSLIYDKKMFISNDKGETWLKVRDLPDPDNSDAAKAAKEIAIAKIGNAVCGNDTVEGKQAETFQADLDISPEAPFQTNIKFWMDAENGNLLKSVTNTKMPGTHHIAVQLVEHAPDLVLPTPE